MVTVTVKANSSLRLIVGLLAYDKLDVITEDMQYFWLGFMFASKKLSHNTFLCLII